MSRVITQTYHIEATIADVWKALLDSKYIDNWGGGPSEIDDKEGTEFEFWGGDIWGTNIEIEKYERIKQEWYGGDWDEPSILTFELEEQGDIVEVRITHENIPEDEVDEVEEGWASQFMEPLKEWLESRID